MIIEKYYPSPVIRSFGEDFDYQSGFYGQIRQIITDNALHFIKISVADETMDMKMATDFVVRVDGGDIAVRIRRSDKKQANGKKYRDLTIRSYKRGYRTELDKLRDGFGRYYLYCWEGETEGRLSEWMLVDLDKFRASGFLDEDEVNKREIPNYDRATKFVAYPYRVLAEKGCLIASNVNEGLLK